MASWLNVVAEVGIVALPIGLLMIAGELDLSIGAIVAGRYGAPEAVGIAAALAIGLPAARLALRELDPRARRGPRERAQRRHSAALGAKQASHVLRIVLEARKRGLAVIFITHQVTHAMAVGDHYAVLIRGALAAKFMRGQKTREEITDLMAGGEALANLDVEIENYEQSHDGHPPPPVA